ncbi:MAG TPA: hypothetical protein VLC74_14205 [Rhizomicrobium sp.]|nr:hypothetical protein [Rhizomicrobium sp.]
MPKGERRRRRNPDLQAEAGAANAAQADEGAAEATQAESSGSSGSAQDGSAAAEESLSSTRGWPDGSPPRQIALAEILVNPELAGPTAVPTPAAKDLRTDALPNREAPKREERTAAPRERAAVQAAPVFDNAASESPPVESAASATHRSYPSDHLNSPPPDDRPRWTREPMLVALLLAALLVLIFDTYFTWRLNGLSDRLAMTSGSVAAAAAERPWVGVDSIKTTQFASGGQPVTTVHIVNSGHEPAYDLRSNTAGSLRAATTPGPSVPAQKGQLAVTALLLPNVGGNLTFFANTRALTAEEAANVRSGQYVLWLAGRLDYRDAHGHPHLTTFRYRYNPALNSFMATPDGNTAN